MIIRVRGWGGYGGRGLVGGGVGGTRNVAIQGSLWERFGAGRECRNIRGMPRNHLGKNENFHFGTEFSRQIQISTSPPAPGLEGMEALPKLVVAAGGVGMDRNLSLGTPGSAQGPRNTRGTMQHRYAMP